MTVMMVGGIAGPLVAGALIPVFRLRWLYLVDAVCLLATLSAVVRLPSLPVDGGSTRKPGLRSVIEGFTYLRTQPVLLMSFVVDIIAMVLGMPRALFPQIADESFHGPPQGGLAFALLFATTPAGAVVGGGFSGWVSRVTYQGRAVVVCIVVWGLSITGFGVAVSVAGASVSWRDTTLVVAMLLLAIGGAADMASAAFRTSMLRADADDWVRGRLQGVFIVVVAGGPRIAGTVHVAAAATAGTAVVMARSTANDQDSGRRSTDQSRSGTPQTIDMASRP